MKRLTDFRVYQEDKLVIRWTGKEGKEYKYYSQGKRVPKSVYEKYPWMREAVRIYVRTGIVSTIKFIRGITGMSISDAKKVIDNVRF